MLLRYLLTRIWVLTQLIFALLAKGKFTPIIMDPLLYQALVAVLFFTVLQFSQGRSAVVNVLSYAVLLIPIGFLIPYLSMLQYFMWHDYLLILGMLLTAVMLMGYKKSI
jgi:hypothetical protein